MNEPFPLVDRVHEMAELRSALDAALAGRGRMLLLAGEPGIGKTRLASAIADVAASRAVPVWWGRCTEDATAPAFWPWNAALRRWIDRAGDEAIVPAVRTHGPELGRVFPVLRPHLPDDRGTDDGRDTIGERFRTLDTASRFLAAVGKAAGLVIVLDDVHWADGPTLELLRLFASEIAEARVLVVATYRDTEVERDHPLSATLARLAREPATQRLALGGLSPADCATWIAATGARGDVPAMAAALHRETNGNPFFVSQILHLVAGEDGLERWTRRGVPHGVREVIDRRLDRLGTGCRATLAVAALLGETIDAGVLEAVLDPTAPRDHLARALRDRILVDDDGRGFAFAHALIRRVLLDDLQPSARAAWQARIAAALKRADASGAINVFRHDGEVWSVRYAGRDVLLKDGKGPRYLASLLAAPGREVHVLQFNAGTSARSSVSQEGLSIGPGASLDDAPDERARRAYRARLADLRDELDEAEAFADGGRAERVRTEMEQIVSQIAGRFSARKTRRGPAETARKAVTKVLRTQIGKLLDLHPALGRHLCDAVRMGTVCVYAPATPIDWEIAFEAS